MKNSGSYIIRPIVANDLSGLFSLSQLAGKGFTSLQPDTAFLEALIAKSEKSFALPSSSVSQTFMLVMQTIETNHIVGCASVKTNVGLDNFICADFEIGGTGSFSQIQKQDYTKLTLKRTLQGFTEVGSLILHPEHRSTGAGRFLARARYMLMGTRPALFDHPIVSQLRGWCDANGHSPFFEGVWSPRISSSYERNDARLAREGAGFLLKQFDGLEINVNALEKAAKKAIGRPHKTATGALKLLEQEGFTKSKLVDLADGGPITIADLKTLVSLKTSRPVSLTPKNADTSTSLAMVSNSSFEEFRACVSLFGVSQEHVTSEPWVSDILRTSKFSPVLMSD